MKIIELTNQHLSYRARYKARRKTLGFKEKHFTKHEGVMPFVYMSYKMWLTKIWGGYMELLFGKKRTTK
jgi:hypothetical protein